MIVNFGTHVSLDAKIAKILSLLLRRIFSSFQVKGIERHVNNTFRQTLTTVITNQRYFCFFVSVVPATPWRLGSPWRVHRRM
jgi:hypothetical protein